LATNDNQFAIVQSCC